MRLVAGAIAQSLSLIVLVLGLGFGVFLILSPSGGGFFTDLGKVMGILVIALGNLASCLLNGLTWLLGPRPRWLGIMLAVQTPPALGAAGWLLQDWAFQ